MRELAQLGHHVSCYEEASSWSLTNLMQERNGALGRTLEQFARTFPELNVGFYNSKENFAEFLEGELKGADLVLIHEWNSPFVVNSILALKKRFGFAALLHDSHHRAYTQPKQILEFNLPFFDGVLAFGAAIRHIYEKGFGVPRTWTFHEAADTRNFKPLNSPKQNDVIWIGNWGDEERTRELQEFLIEPVENIPGCRAIAHGVRYPSTALEKLRSAGIDYRGYLPNLEAPAAYGESMVALHIPRRQYANGLSGIPTIRVFEAMACGIPLLCSPWSDEENLFHPGSDYLVAKDGANMKAVLTELLRDEKARCQIGEHALNTIHRSHTCAHRAQQLLEIWEEIAA